MSNQICCRSSLIRPFCFLILLGSLTYIIFNLCSMTLQINHTVAAHCHQLHNKTLSEIESSAKSLYPLNSSALSLARALSCTLKGSQLPFKAIQIKVAPALFLALSTIPHVSQVSFLGSDGLFFAYYYDGDQTRAMYSDLSFSSKWYIQPVNRDTGKLYGQPVITTAEFSAHESWIQEALNKTIVYSYLGVGFDKAQTLLFKNMVRMDGRGLIIVGFPARVVGDHFSRSELIRGGDFHLASDDGTVLVHTKLPDTQIIVRNGSVTMKSRKPNGWDTGLHSCRPEDGNSRKFHVPIKGFTHTVYCSTLEIAGLHSVYTMAFPAKEWDNLIYENSKLSLTLLILMFVIVVTALCIYVILILKAARREMILWAEREKQLEYTQQAECKSMYKSLAFAKATHDIRNSLIAIADLIDLCHKDVVPNSELAGKIAQIKTCTKDLIDLLDNVLDTKKIEAGKVQLENKEFDLQLLLEDVVDMYYPLGKKKGVDVILDPCDGSIFKSRLVKGDRGKLKQILCNLLSNAVKFTSKGHVTVRGIVKKTSKCSSNTSGLLKYLYLLKYFNNDSFNDLDDLRTVQENPNHMDFEFDVDDTGHGIEKHRQKDVFLYYVQVKETALGQEGCGLGLGIVQSLVRLMGGEIKIVDKDPLDGTWFKFNINLMVCDPVSCTGLVGQETYVHNDAQSHDFHPHFGLHIPFPASRSDGSHVVLHISGEERGRILKKFIESRGVKVSSVKQMTEFSRVLDKTILRLNGLSSLDGTEMISEYLNNSASRKSNSGPQDESSGSSDAGDHPLSNYKSSISRGSSSFILIMIDADAITVPILELCSVIANFRRKIHNSSCCKVVWLDIPITRNAKLKLELDEDNTTSSDIVLSKPFHGSRLYDVLGLLPEFKDTYHNNSPKIGSETAHGVLHSKVLNTTNDLITSSPRKNQHLEKIVIHECDEQNNAEELPLCGKKILVVEDGEVLRKVATAKISKLGAVVDTSENGQEAFDQVYGVLSKQRMEAESSKSLPYDYILMDCEMPVVDGYEATRRIRLEEKKYGVYIPIIALTANASTEEARSKTKDAGMDFHLTKPLQVDKLLDAIRDIESSKETHS